MVSDVVSSRSFGKLFPSPLETTDACNLGIVGRDNRKTQNYGEPYQEMTLASPECPGYLRFSRNTPGHNLRTTTQKSESPFRW